MSSETLNPKPLNCSLALNPTPVNWSFAVFPMPDLEPLSATVHEHIMPREDAAGRKNSVFLVSGLGFGVWGLRFGVQGLRFGFGV